MFGKVPSGPAVSSSASISVRRFGFCEADPDGWVVGHDAGLTALLSSVTDADTKERDAPAGLGKREGMGPDRGTKGSPATVGNTECSLLEPQGVTARVEKDPVSVAGKIFMGYAPRED